MTEQARVLFAGTKGNGVWRSADRGANWVKVHDLGTKGDPECWPADRGLPSVADN